MLDQVDLSREMSRTDYAAEIDALELRIGELQREAVEWKVPVIIVFEGWDAAGKGTLINKLLLSLDPRGFNVYPTNPPTEEERLRPFLWRFWTRTPARGRLAIFDRSWYGQVLVGRIDKLVPKKRWKRAYEEINAFERQLADDGTVIVKFFLHITKKEQKKRFRNLRKDPNTSWKVTREDWRHHKQYGEYLVATDEMLERTSRSEAPWTVVEAHDQRYATIKMFKTVIRAIAGRIEARKAALGSGNIALALVGADTGYGEESILDKVDLSRTIARDDYELLVDRYQKRMWELEHQIYLKRVSVIVLYEGWDAGGKGGAIKRLVRSMDPRGYEVIPIAAPNDVEKSHHYLWRFWNRIPKAGHIAIFDRTWYGRVLVERIEGFCSQDAWRRAYTEINEMEAHMAASGAVLVKFWIHVSPEEQLRRFEERQDTPYKQWKITEEDWRNREKRPAYRVAVDEMLFRTSTTQAPWTVVEGDCKLYARIKTLKTVIDAIEMRLDGR